MSFVVTPPGNLDPLVVSFADVTTPVVHNTSTASIIRKSGRVSYNNTAKSFVGPKGTYSIVVSLFPTYAAATAEFWQANIGSNSPATPVLYCDFHDPSYPTDSPPIILQNNFVFVANGFTGDGTGPGGGFSLTTLNVAARGFASLVVAVTFMG